MKVLLDECVTHYLKRDFAAHEVLTVEEAGFKGLKNGQLLQAASGEYDVLITVDQNLHYQQNLKTCYRGHRVEGKEKHISDVKAVDAAGA